MEVEPSDSRLFDHICKPDDAEVTPASNRYHEGYKCGGCRQELRTICQLHEHLLKEFLLGSYHYDNITKTAYPKLDLVSTGTQTDDKDIAQLLGISNDVCNDPERVSENVGEIIPLADIKQEFENGKDIVIRKRKYVKRNYETNLETVTKKRAKSKNSKVLKTEKILQTETEEEKNVVSEMLNTTVNCFDTNLKHNCDIKEEVVDNNYDESTDDNLENIFERKTEDTEQTEIKISIKKTKKNTRKKNKVSTKKKNKIFGKEEVEKDRITRNKISLVKDVKKENYDHEESSSAGNTKQKEHLKTKTEMFTCKHCNSVFRSERRYNIHLHRLHRSIYPYSCKQCSLKPFKNKEEYVEHKDQHPKQFYKCELCGKELKSREGLRLHEFIHSGEKPFFCDKCDYRGRTSTQLRQHMYTHMDSKTEQCELCGKAFFTKGKLKEHLRYCRKEFNHHCPHCQKGFPTASGLRKHILMHTGERAFVCDVCGFATFRITLLKSHMRTHTGEKPYKCKECGAKLATRGTLLLHVRTHTHEKPFVCSYCSKAFTSKWNLQTHLRQHTGETPYKCDICGQGFKQNVLRKSHMRSHLESTSAEISTTKRNNMLQDLHETMETDPTEQSIHNHVLTTEGMEPAIVPDRRLERYKVNLNNLVCNRSYSENLLNQALQNEDMHPLDLKLHLSSASDLKTVYNNSVINSHQLQTTSFENMNCQDIKHM